MPKEKIDALVRWLEPRLGKLIQHSQQMRQILSASGGSAAAVNCAVGLLATADDDDQHPLSPGQVETWKATLPLLVEHSLMVVNGGAPALEQDELFNMSKAARYLGIGERKLQNEMKKRAIAYQKLGIGRTSPIRFQRVALDKYLANRTLPAR